MSSSGEEEQKATSSAGCSTSVWVEAQQRMLPGVAHNDGAAWELGCGRSVRWMQAPGSRWRAERGYVAHKKRLQTFVSTSDVNGDLGGALLFARVWQKTGGDNGQRGMCCLRAFAELSESDSNA